MPPRLLTLLGLIQNALANLGSEAVASPPARSVNFHKAVAQMSFADGSGSIMLQNFTLADGQICVRAVFAWADGLENGTSSIYPRDNFDWLAAADHIAAAWIAGKPQPIVAPPVTQSNPVSAPAEAEASSPAEVVAATG